MNYDTANRLLYIVKVGQRGQDAWTDACEYLAEVLRDNMLPKAQKKYKAHAAPVVDIAVAKAMDRIRSCTMYWDSPKFELYNLLHPAWVQYLGIISRPRAESSPLDRVRAAMEDLAEEWPNKSAENRCAELKRWRTNLGQLKEKNSKLCQEPWFAALERLLDRLANGEETTHPGAWLEVLEKLRNPELSEPATWPAALKNLLERWQEMKADDWQADFPITTLVLSEVQDQDASRPCDQGIELGVKNALALAKLLVLSQRPWAYISLWFARDHSVGWKGRLADAYLSQYGGRKALIAGHVADFEGIRDNFEVALDEIEKTILPTDPIESVLDGLQGIPLRHDRQPDIPAILHYLCAHRPQPAADKAAGYCSQKYSCLGAALECVCTHLAPISGQAASAVEELSKELAMPGDVLKLPQTGGLCVHAVLEKLPQRRKTGDKLETPPAEMLRKIADLEVEEPQLPPLVDKIPRQELLAILAALVPRDSPQESIFLDIRLGRSLHVACDALRERLPGPAVLAASEGECLQVAKKVLAQWLLVIENHRHPPIDGGGMDLPACWWEISEKVRADGPPLERALAAMSNWLEKPEFAPGSWSGVPAEIEPVVRRALCLAFLTELDIDLTLVYQARGKWGIVPRLVEHILGQEWRDPNAYPPAEEVRRRLDLVLSGKVKNVDCGGNGTASSEDA